METPQEKSQKQSSLLVQSILKKQHPTDILGIINEKYVDGIS